MVRPKLFAPNHQVRLYLEDEAKLACLPGKTPAAKIRDLVHKALMPDSPFPHCPLKGESQPKVINR